MRKFANLVCGHFFTKTVDFVTKYFKNPILSYRHKITVKSNWEICNFFLFDHLLGPHSCKLAILHSKKGGHFKSPKSGLWTNLNFSYVCSKYGSRPQAKSKMMPSNESLSKWWLVRPIIKNIVSDTWVPHICSFSL